MKELNPQSLSGISEKAVIANKNYSNLEMKTILLIEDDVIVLEMLQEVLVQSGYCVLIAKNAFDALENFNSSNKNIACVVLDYGIPGMHPARLLEKIQEKSPGTQYVVSSGYSSNFVAEDFPLDNNIAFLAKPYDPSRLVEEIDNLLK